MIDKLKFFLDYSGGGTWSFLVGGLTCQVDFGNERDFLLLISATKKYWLVYFEIHLLKNDGSRKQQQVFDAP